MTKPTKSVKAFYKNLNPKSKAILTTKSQESMVFFFYSRTSTLLQNSARQIETFKTHEGFDPSRLFVERIQGNIPFMESPEAVRMFDELSNQSERCTVVVDSLDRLGRNLLDILHTIDLFTKNKINLKSIKEGFTTLLDNGDVDKKKAPHPWSFRILFVRLIPAQTA